MSPDPRTPVVTARPPSEARLAAGDLQAALERMLAAREAAAFEAGRREGEASMRASIVGAVDEAVARLDTSREEALTHLNHTAVGLAVEIARQLLRVELPTGRYDLEGIVREALSFSGAGRGRCVVHLHPADAGALEGVPFRAGTEIEADPSVSRGSVHVTTPHGLLVRDLDEALRAIGERLLENLP